MPKKRKITEFFDPHDKVHLKAYETLEKTGVWPEGFIPEDVEITTCWQISLASVMAGLWVAKNLEED